MVKCGGVVERINKVLKDVKLIHTCHRSLIKASMMKKNKKTKLKTNG